MKNDHPGYYNSVDLGRKVTLYAAEHSSKLPEHIADYHASASSHRASIMLTSNFQSQFHTMLANIAGAKRVLEIGVYLGYSAMVWSDAVGPGGFVTGLELDAEYAKLAGDAIAARGINNVEIIVGPALDSLKSLTVTEPYDLVFLDADKTGYMGYIEHLLAASQPGQSSGRLLRPGALIVADNVLQSGNVVDARSKPNEYVDAVRQYNEYCVSEPRLQSVLLPLWDGLSIARLID